MIRLRPFKTGDSETMERWLPEQRQFAMWCAGKFQYPLTAEQIRKYAAAMEMEEYAWIMAALNEEGELVGHFMIRKADYERNSAHLGFIVVDPDRRGKGYGKEMVSQAVKYAFEILGMKRVTLGVVESNQAAYACYLAVGFHVEERMEQGYTYEGEEWPFCLMAIEKETDSSILN